MECLGDYSGFIQRDGFSAYVALADNTKPTLVLAGCWAHVYRRVRETNKHHPIQAGWIMRQRQHLYAVEKSCDKPTPHRNNVSRNGKKKSRPALERLHRPFKLMEKRILNKNLVLKSTMGKATSHALGQWSGSEDFLNVGQL